ncbi:radical SAM protein [Candidatus Woesearchaeota archaeon]|nr:radical SAM protein [Candidatus Woesearchaeota archaeon]
MTQILTATGCSQKCDFCSAQLAYVPFRVNTVINHLKRLVGLGYKAIFFNDPNFTNPFKDSRLFLAQNKLDVYARVKNLMNAIISSGINKELVWGCQTKASMVNPDLLDLMGEAGCRYITYALENVDRESLREMHKGITPKIVQRAIAWAKERGMKTGLYVMFGTKPDREEDFEIAKRTLDYVEGLQPDYLSISILANYPMIDRSNPEQRRHMQLDYAKQRYSRETVWLFFDEGWGAFHPYCDAQQAARYKQEIEARKQNNPHVWDNIRMF